MSARSARRTLLPLVALLMTPQFLRAQAPASSPPSAAPQAPAKTSVPAVQQAAAQFERAVKLQRAGKSAEAIAAYKLFLHQVALAKLPPASMLPAFRNLAALYQARGDRQSAEASLQQVVGVDPHDAAAYATLAALYADDKRYDLARTMATHALSLSSAPNITFPLHFTLGNMALVDNDYMTAEKEFAIAIGISPKNAAAYLNYGIALSNQKKFSQALAAYEKAHALGNNAQAPFAIALTRQELHDIPGAIAAYNFLLRVQPHNPNARFNRALLLQQEGKSQEAITDYLETLDAQPKNYPAQYSVGQLYAEIENYVAAEIHLKAALALRPQNPPVLTMLGYCEMQQATQLPNPADRTPGYRQAETHLKAALALAPQEKTAQSALGFLYEKMARYDDALALYHKMQAAEPDKTAAYYRIARVYIQQVKPDKVLETWKQYRTYKPDDPTSYEEAAQVLEGQGKPELALAEWKALLARHPDNARAMVSVGKDLVRLKRTDEARAQFKAVVALEPPGKSADPRQRPALFAAQEDARQEALRSLAQLAQSEGQIEEAIEWWNQLKGREAVEASRTGQSPKTDTYERIARAYEQIKKPDLALAEWRALAQIEPQDATPYQEMGRLLGEQQQIEEAVAAYREAARRSKDTVATHLLIADLYRRNHQLDKAVAEYNALKAEHPRDTRLYASLAQTYEQAGNNELALTAYDALLQTDPSATWAEGRKAVVLTRLKRYAEARALYEQMLTQRPEELQTYADLANVYTQEGQPDAFQTWLQSRFEQKSVSHAMMEALLDTYKRQKREEAGWDYLHALAEKRKTDRAFLETYAAELDQHQRKTEAENVYRQIAAQFPNDVEAQTRLVAQLDAAGKKDEGTKIYVTLAARSDLTPKQRALVRRTLAQRYTRDGKSAEAIPLLQDAMKDDPHDLSAAGLLAQALMAAGRESEVVPLYVRLSGETAFPLPIRAQMLTLVGNIYEKQGHKPDAIDEYHEALKLDPNHKEALDALKRLGEK